MKYKFLLATVFISVLLGSACGEPEQQTVSQPAINEIPQQQQKTEGEPLTDEDVQKLVSAFIENVKYKNKGTIADNISYPFRREYPIPVIMNKQEFVARYDEIFDEALTNEIINSDPAKDWSAVGSKGIMLSDGDVWLNSDGILIAVNHESEAERKKKESLIAADKQALYQPLQTFKAPAYILETPKFRIRIDDMGNDNYRYASWPISADMSTKPDLVIGNGEWVPEGSGGNSKYIFKNNGYTYECAIWVLHEYDAPPATLTIYKGDKKIMSQDAKIVGQ
jgi:hypothetical protein